MKRIIAIVLLMVTVLCCAGCGTADEGKNIPETKATTNPTETTASETEPPTVATTETLTEAPTETKHVNGASGNVLILGNIKFTIPDGFILTEVGENTFHLAPKDSSCHIGLYAVDISALDEDEALAHLSIQRDIFMGEDGRRIDEDTLDGYVARRDVVMDFYGVIDTDLQITTHLDVTFTDSWYAYTIFFQSDAGSEYLNDNLTTFIYFTAYSEYIGDTPRFNSVQ